MHCSPRGAGLSNKVDRDAWERRSEAREASSKRLTAPSFLRYFPPYCFRARSTCAEVEPRGHGAEGHGHGASVAVDATEGPEPLLLRDHRRRLGTTGRADWTHEAQLGHEVWILSALVSCSGVRRTVSAYWVMVT